MSEAHQPAIGWVLTFGSNGFKMWRGSFYGQLGTFTVDYPLWLRYFNIGVKNFIGFKIQGTLFTHMFGNADEVSLDYEPPT